MKNQLIMAHIRLMKCDDGWVHSSWRDYRLRAFTGTIDLSRNLRHPFHFENHYCTVDSCAIASLIMRSVHENVRFHTSWHCPAWLFPYVYNRNLHYTILSSNILSLPLVRVDCMDFTIGDIYPQCSTGVYIGNKAWTNQGPWIYRNLNQI